MRSLKRDKQAMAGNLLTDEIKLGNLRETILELESLQERASWEGQTKASVYLKQRLQDMDLEPKIQTYRHKEKVWENVIVLFRGSVDTEETLLAVTHYDSKNWIVQTDSPGADDNGTGVAVLLELARIFKHRPNKSNIILVFSSNEEYGNAGSRYFARQAKEKGMDIVGVINIDVVGYNDPWALFSRKPFDSLIEKRFSFNRKAKIIAKMCYNWVMSWVFGPQSLKVVGHNGDKHLIPENLDGRKTIGEDRVLWKIDNHDT